MILTNPAYRQTRTGTWEVRFWIVDGVHRKRKFKGGFRLRSHAERWFRDFRVQVESGSVQLDPLTARPIQSAAPLLSAFIGQYFAEFPHRRSDRTVQLNRIALRRFSDAVPDRPVSEYTSRDIESFLAARRRAGKSPHTTNRELVYIRKLFATAERWKLITENPASEIKRDRLPEGQVKYLTIEQQSALVDACLAVQSAKQADEETPYLHALVVMALRTGMRRGELYNLRWTDLDWQNSRITIRSTHEWRPKSGKSRIVPFDQDAQLALKRWQTWLESTLKAALGDSKGMVGERLLKAKHRVSVLKAVSKSPLVFPSFRTAGVLHDTPNALADAYAAAGLSNLGMHALRHTFAVTCALNRVPIALLSELLGHADIQTTQIYLRFYPGDALTGFSLPSLATQ